MDVEPDNVGGGENVEDGADLVDTGPDELLAELSKPDAIMGKNVANDAKRCVSFNRACNSSTGPQVCCLCA